MLKRILLSVLVLGLLYIASPGPIWPAQARPDVPAAADLNQDRLFDDLALSLEGRADYDQFKVVVVFDETYNLQGIKNALGEFAVKYQYQNLNAFAGTLNKGQITALSHMPGVKHIQSDAPAEAYMDSASYYFGANWAREKFGVNGDMDGSKNFSKNDVVIAVLDTGIDTSHVDLDSGKVIGWQDFVNGIAIPYDDHGHGTWVASIAAGTGEGNPAYIGVAPYAALVGVKVLNNRGAGLTSDIDAGIDWCIANRTVYNIRILNISFGYGGSSNGLDSTSLLLNSAFNVGIVPVVAAGANAINGSAYTTGSPAAAANAITVGSMADPSDGGFYLLPGSSRGYTADGRLKPEICGPGYQITAARAGTENQYLTMSGSSGSAPFVSGTLALMVDANPLLSAAQLKNCLLLAAQDWGKPNQDIDYGKGRLQTYRAVGAATGINIYDPWSLYHGTAYDSLPGSAYYDKYTFFVSSTSYPLAITLIGEATSGYPDLDLYLFGPDGYQDAVAYGNGRQLTVSIMPDQIGWYTLRVYSYSGSGNYYMDLSVDGYSLQQIANDVHEEGQ